jgi:O-antigen ligase
LGLFLYINSAKNSQSDGGSHHYKVSILESRLPYWTQAIRSIQMNPWFGQGPGTFLLISKQFQKTPDTNSWFAHSYLLQTFSEVGVFGFIAFIFLIVISLQASGINLNKQAILSTERTAAMLGVVLVLIYRLI